jgi:hypothetical protein
VSKKNDELENFFTKRGCVVDPDPHQEPYVFGPLGSASEFNSHKYGSGSGSFHHQAKIVRKTLISTVL